jgi:pyridoxine 4-dehydrogenase
MTDQDARPNAAAAGTFSLGGDLLVNRLGFGAMRLTGRGILGEPEDPEQARRVLRRVVELEVNLIDTADSYGPEVSERLIADALHPYPDELVVATKGGLTPWWSMGLRRSPRAPARSVRGQPEKTQGGAHRPLPVT